MSVNIRGRVRFKYIFWIMKLHRPNDLVMTNVFRKWMNDIEDWTLIQAIFNLPTYRN